MEDEMILYLRWLALFIAALVLIPPKLRREGIPQRPILKGNRKYTLSWRKVVFACKAPDHDATVGSAMTFVLLL